MSRIMHHVGPLPFQARVRLWIEDCFGRTISDDAVERNYRFLEEGLELVQSLGCSRDDAHSLVDYVFDRPSGDPCQEAGGTMVTLAALCAANGISMAQEGETELARISTPETIEKIRKKQAEKPRLVRSEPKSFSLEGTGFTLKDCGCISDRCEGRTDGTCHNQEN